MKIIGMLDANNRITLIHFYAGNIDIKSPIRYAHKETYK
jgi:hypothetical protein